MNTNNIYVDNQTDIENLGSAITIEGLEIGPDGTEAFADFLNEKATFKAEVPDCYIIKGKTMNRVYGLTGDNRYHPDLNIVAFKLSAFEHSDKLVMARFEVGARWLDDIIDNKLAREAR